MSERHFDRQSERNALDDFLTKEPEHTWADKVEGLCVEVRDLIDIVETVIRQTEDNWWVDSDIAEERVVAVKNILDKVEQEWR